MTYMRFKPGTYYLSQRVLVLTELFNKMYFWMQDVDGSIYLCKAQPQRAVSVAGHDPKSPEVFTTGWVPDFS